MEQKKSGPIVSDEHSNIEVKVVHSFDVPYFFISISKINLLFNYCR